MSLQYSEITISRASLVVQWLKLHTLNAGGLGSTLGWGTKIQRAMTKNLHVAMKVPVCRN